MGLKLSKGNSSESGVELHGGSTTQSVTSSVSAASHHGRRNITATVVAFKAVDSTNLRKLKKALALGAGVGVIRATPVPGGGATVVGVGGIPSTGEALTLLEYAVEKNFQAGVDIMLQDNYPLWQDTRSVTAAFLRSCDGGYLRLGIFNAFVDAAIAGKISLDLHAAYSQLVDHFMYRKPFELVCRPFFNLATLHTLSCRISPLGLAVIHDDVDAIQAFVCRGADVNGYDRDGNTALLRAAYGLKRTCFRKLTLASARSVTVWNGMPYRDFCCSIKSIPLLLQARSPYRLLLLGADPNLRSCKRATSSLLTSTTSPLIAICMAFGQCNRSRSGFVSALILCGLEPTSDRIWYTSSPRGFVASCLARRLDDETQAALVSLCGVPRRLELLCLCVVRRQLAAAQCAGVEKNADQLPLPTAIKVQLKLENLNPDL